ncbi:MAG: phosphohydrolase [Acetobacteraceae bacterium]
MKPDRAWTLLPSGPRLNLLAPDPQSWTDRDLAIGLSRTYRWGGYSAWDLPLSVAQHSLAVLALRRRDAAGKLTPAEAVRELLHDAIEALMGGWDPITPLKPHLGAGYARLARCLQAAVDARYDLPAWGAADLLAHKQADRLAAASEAFHVAGWSQEELRSELGITLDPLDNDPLVPPAGMRPWEPWSPRTAETRFLDMLQRLQAAIAGEGRGA